MSYVRYYIWTAVHTATACMWASTLYVTLRELVTTGELARTADTATRFSAGRVVFFLCLCGLTLASAIRAICLETRP